MAFLDELSKKVQDLTYAATEKAQEVAAAATEKGKDVAAAASEKAGALADSAKTSMTILNEKRSIEKNLRAIGEWYLSTLDGEAPAAVADVVAAVRASQAKVAELEAQRAPTEEAKEAPAEAPNEE